MLVAHAVRALAPFPAARIEIDARTQLEQLGEIAAFDRQVGNELVADGAAEYGAGGFTSGRASVTVTVWFCSPG